MGTQVDHNEPRPAAGAAIIDWVVGQGLLGATVENLINGYYERLGEAQVPVSRLYVGTMVAHPQYKGFGLVRRRDADLSEEAYGYTTGSTERWDQSPLKAATESNSGEVRFDVRDPDSQVRFPVFADFVAEGGTDYYSRAFLYGVDGEPAEGIGTIFSWLTDHPDGFTEDHIDVLRSSAPALALGVRMAINRRVARAVTAAYLGRDAGQRVLSGEVRRGEADTLQAVLLYGDLRGFTAHGDQMAQQELVTMLNDYLTCMAEPVEESGGQVLKFMGDEMLATFEIGEGTGRDPGSVCQLALHTSLDILRRIAELNETRRADGQPALVLDLALHLGEVLYGNVGSPQRLDFTVVGPAVNEASRMEAMCGPLDRNLLISSAFAKAMPRYSEHELIALGRHGLRGVREPVELFTLADVPRA